MTKLFNRDGSIPRGLPRGWMPPAVIGAKPLSVIPRGLPRGGFIRQFLGVLLFFHVAPKVLLGAEAVYATATVSALKQEFAPDAPKKMKARDVYVVRYKVVVVNKGTHPIRIPTAGFAQPTEAGSDYIKTKLVWDLPAEDQGTRTVVSEVELKPVLLRPNEAVVFRWTESEFNLSRLDKVQLTLFITEAFGKRYDFWFGEIPVTDIQVYREKDKQP